MNETTPTAMTVADDGGDRARKLVAAAGALLGPGIPADFVGSPGTELEFAL